MNGALFDGAKRSLAIGTLVCTACLAGAPPVSAEPGVLAGKRVADRQLAGQRGGADAGSGATLAGAVSGNQAVNVSSGGNSIGGGAFAGAAGVPIVIQNSGSNVLIQSSVIVNLQLK